MTCARCGATREHHVAHPFGPDGALLADPSGIVEGTGKRIRHVKCRSVADVERPAVRTLVEAQIAARPRRSG